MGLLYEKLEWIKGERKKAENAPDLIRSRDLKRLEKLEYKLKVAWWEAECIVKDKNEEEIKLTYFISKAKSPGFDPLYLESAEKREYRELLAEFIAEKYQEKYKRVLSI